MVAKGAHSLLDNDAYDLLLPATLGKPSVYKFFSYFRSEGYPSALPHLVSFNFL
jgi:hypothetical protein